MFDYRKRKTQHIQHGSNPFLLFFARRPAKPWPFWHISPWHGMAVRPTSLATLLLPSLGHPGLDPFGHDHELHAEEPFDQDLLLFQRGKFCRTVKKHVVGFWHVFKMTGHHLYHLLKKCPKVEWMPVPACHQPLVLEEWTVALSARCLRPSVPNSFRWPCVPPLAPIDTTPGHRVGIYLLVLSEVFCCPHTWFCLSHL